MKERLVRACAFGMRSIGMKRRAWNLTFRHGNKYGGQSPKLAALFSELANGGSIVEHGCGIGTLPAQLGPKSFSHYTGYDIADESIGVAKKQGLDRCCFLRMSMEEWNGEECPVDLLICKEVVYYLTATDLRSFIARAQASLADQGTIAITVHDRVKRAQAISVCMELGAQEIISGSPVVLALRKV